MGLRIARHKTFYQHEWVAQRIGWAVFVLIVLAAVSGLLGSGPLNSALAMGADGLVRVEYSRFLHQQADELVTVTIAPAAVFGGPVDIELAAAWLRAVSISDIIPQPREQTATSYGLRLTFPSEPGAEVVVRISYRATTIGQLNGGVRFRGDTVSFGQFVYP